jgi:hypothetical protein
MYQISLGAIMDRAMMIFPWVVTLIVIGYIAAVGVHIHNEGVEWEQACKESNGYPTSATVMDFHSKVTRLCINPQSVVQVD